MLDGVKQSGKGDEKFYLVFSSRRLCQLGPDPSSNGTVKVKWLTDNLELANEMAMYHFRELWSEICTDALGEGCLKWDRIAVKEGQQRSSPLPPPPPLIPGLSWEMNDNACLRLYGSVGEAKSVGVWVEPRLLIRACT